MEILHVHDFVNLEGNFTFTSQENKNPKKRPLHMWKTDVRRQRINFKELTEFSIYAFSIVWLNTARAESAAVFT